MKMPILILLTSVIVCFAGEPDSKPVQAALPEITIKHRDVTNAGQVVASVETVYRGKDRILETVRYKVARGNYSIGGGWRTYRVEGAPVLLEEDYKGDGNVTVRVLGKSGDPEGFEAFQRQANGSIEPVSSTELARLKRENRELREFSEGFAGWVGDQLKTNSPEKVMSDVKKVGDVLKKAQEVQEQQKVQKKE